MAKYKIIFDGEEEDDVFDTREEAEEHALYLSSCARTGAEILHWPNGTWFWTVDRGEVIETADGRLAIISACLDVTKEHEQQEARICWGQ